MNWIELSRSGIKSNPDFTKLLVQVSGNKSKINKIMKTHKLKKYLKKNYQITGVIERFYLFSLEK